MRFAGCQLDYFHHIAASIGAPRSSKHANLQALDRLAVSAEFSVPPTYVLDARRIDSYQSLRESQAPSDGPFAYKLSESERIELRTQLESVLGEEGAFCVRSLSDVENDNGRFAGVYHSEIGVSRHKVCEAIDSVLGQSVSPAVTQSLTRAGIERFPAMSVGIQPYVGGPGWIGGVVQAPFGPMQPRLACLVSVGKCASDITAGKVVSEDHLIAVTDHDLMLLERTPGEDTEGSFLLDHARMEKLLRNVLSLRDVFDATIEVEWAMSPSCELFVLQVRELRSRPQIGVSGRAVKKEPLCTGFAVGNGRVVGRAYVTNTHPKVELSERDILVAPAVSEDWFEHVERVGGLATRLGSRNAHVASIASEANTLCAVGCDRDLQGIAHGDLITLACTEGLEARIYSGDIERAPLELEEDYRIKSPAEAISIMRNYLPSSVTFDLQAYFARFRIFSDTGTLIGGNARVHLGYPNLETFVQSKLCEALLFLRVALPDTQIRIDLGEYLPLAGHLHAAKTKLKTLYGIRFEV